LFFVGSAQICARFFSAAVNVPAIVVVSVRQLGLHHLPGPGSCFSSTLSGAPMLGMVIGTPLPDRLFFARG
jgi:hypothetical protein